MVHVQIVTEGKDRLIDSMRVKGESICETSNVWRTTSVTSFGLAKTSHIADVDSLQAIPLIISAVCIRACSREHHGVTTNHHSEFEFRPPRLPRPVVQGG